MSREARLYVLDEPIGGVDPAARDYILNTIINNYSPTSTVLISTHLISQILSQSWMRLSSLKDGKVVRQGNVDDIRYESGESIDQLFRQEFKAYKGDIMFWNLVRYEFKNVNKWYLALYGLCLQFQF